MSAPRHVLITADTVGGVWNYSLELARNLAELGTYISLATMGPGLSAAQRRDAQSVTNLRVLESDYRLEWMDDPWVDVDAAGKWLLALERELNPDVVHLNGYAHGTLPWRNPSVVVAHSCVFSWWNAVLGCDPPECWNQYQLRVSDGLRGADGVVAISGAMRAALRRHYGFADSVVIRNGLPPAPYQRAAKEEIILTSGRAWDEAKNIRALDAVAADLPWPTYVAGEVTHPQGGTAILKYSQALGTLPHRELCEWLSRAAIYALPTRYEPFGLSVLEAALSGCALVLGDIPSLRELWDDAAVFVPPDDSIAIRNAILQLIEVPARRTDLAELAMRRAASYSIDRMVSSYLDAYESAKSTHALRQEAVA